MPLFYYRPETPENEGSDDQPPQLEPQVTIPSIRQKQVIKGKLGNAPPKSSTKHKDVSLSPSLV